MRSMFRFGGGSGRPSNIKSVFLKKLTPQGHTRSPMTTADDRFSGNQRTWASAGRMGIRHVIEHSGSSVCYSNIVLVT